jgi:signal transduction histidine kinase
LSLLIGDQDAGEVSLRSCELIAELLEVAACSIAVLDEKGTTLELSAATHIARAEWPQIRIPVAGGIYEQVLERRQSLLLRDREDFQKYFHREPDPRYASASCVVVPLLIQDRAVGVVNVAHPLNRSGFHRRDVALLEAVARLVGSALHTALQYQEAVRLQKKLTDLFNSLHVGIVVVDGQERVIQSNKSAQRLFHFSQKGQPPLEQVLHGTVYNVCCRLIRRIKENGGGADDSLELKRGDDRVLIKIRVIRAMEALPGEHLIMFEEAGQEEEVRRLRESENAKHAFLAIISHELRTPLTVLRGALPLIAPRDKPISPETLSQVHRLLSDNSHRLSEVVNSILYVTEIESGTLELTLRPTDLHGLLMEILDRHTANATRKRVRLTPRFEADQAEIAVDGQRLATVFSELITNAIKFSEPDTEVLVRTRLQPPWLEIQVTNVGQRIDPRQRREIFQKFYQSNQTLTRTAGGCGLGLFLVENIVRLHGGTVDLLESEGAETTFRVRLPLERPGEPRPTRPA